MTTEQLINQELGRRYLGKMIAGPSYDPAPFVVVRVYWELDVDCAQVWFWSDEKRKSGDTRGLRFFMDAELPEIISTIP